MKFILLFIPLNLIIFSTLAAQDTTYALNMEKPQNLEAFRPVFHFAPVNQDTTNACWSFSTLSFIETEVQRIKGKPVKLAVMFPVYYAFMEKAKK